MKNNIEPVKMTWYDAKNQFYTEIENEVEKRIKERKEKEEYELMIKTHIEKYPIGSYIEYIGVKMIVKNNIFIMACYPTWIKTPVIYAEWMDKHNTLNQKQFNINEFINVKIVEEKK